MKPVCGALLILVLVSGCGGSLMGGEFDSERALLAATGDFAKIGAFDLDFPARVIRIEEGHDAIRFMRGATPQEYRGFDGYDLKVVHTLHGSTEGTLVLRSRERRADAVSARPPR